MQSVDPSTYHQSPADNCLNNENSVERPSSEAVRGQNPSEIDNDSNPGSDANAAQRVSEGRCLVSRGDDESSSDGSGSIAGSEEFDELEDCLLSITNGVNCLYNFSIAIRNPTKRDQSFKWKSVDRFCYTKYDIEHVRNKFPKAQEYLVNRLGEGNTQRRQLLEYNNLHRQKIAAPEFDDNDTRTIAFTSTTVPTYVSPEGKDPSQFNLKDLDFDTCSDGNVSKTSCGSSGSSADLITLKIPEPPSPEAYNGTPFECQFCFSFIRIKGRDAWK